MIIEDYFRQVDTLIANASIVHSSNITYDKRSTHIGFIRGDIYFLDGSLMKAANQMLCRLLSLTSKQFWPKFRA